MEEEKHRDWYIDFINENEKDIKIIKSKLSYLDKIFKSFLQEIQNQNCVKNYMSMRYGFVFENILDFDFFKTNKNEIYYLSFVVNFLSVIVKENNWNWINYLDKSKHLLLSFLRFMQFYSLYDLQENEKRETWYDDYYFLVPKDLNLLIETSKNLNIKNWLSFKISQFYKSESLEEKESILYILTKDLIDDDLGKNYEGTFFTKEELQNTWRKKIHAIRHGKNGLNKNKDNEWWEKYNNKFNENQKNDFLEELLLFVTVFLIEKVHKKIQNNNNNFNI